MLPSLRNFTESFYSVRLDRVLPRELPARAVLLRTDRIGDHIIFSSFIEALRRAWPRTQLALVGPKNQEELYTACPLIDEYMPFEFSRESRAEIYRFIRKFAPDWIINPMADRSLLSDRIMRYCHAKVRVGWASRAGGADHRDSARYDRYYTHLFSQPSYPVWHPEQQRNLDFLRLLQVEAASDETKVWTSPEAIASAQNIFCEAKFAPESTMIGFLGSSKSLKTAPQLKDYLVRLMRDFQMNVILVGSGEDHGSSEPPEESLRPRWLNLCGKTSLHETAELMRLARVAVGVDSGPAHLAAAVKTPHVIAMNGTCFGRFLPSNAWSSVVLHPLECFMCQAHCRFDRPYCVTDIPYEVFREAVKDALTTRTGRARIYHGGPKKKFLVQPQPEIRNVVDPAWINPEKSDVIEVVDPAHS